VIQILRRRLAAAVVLVLLMTTMSACSGTVKETAPPEVTVQAPNNLIVFTTVEDFAKGKHEGTRTLASGNGALALAEGLARGTYTSPEVETKLFEYMILSWNVDTPEGTYIEIEGRVRAGVEGKRQWSGWLSWGNWSTTTFIAEDGKVALPGSALAAKSEDSIAKISTDELFVRGSAGETADRFQYRVTLHGLPDKKTAPKVYLVASTVRNSLKGQAIPKPIAQGAPDLTKLEKDLDVPVYSQYLRHSTISGSICSPTSLAMALAYRGSDVSPEEAAWGVRDYVADMFGNWPFNTAYASAHGLSSYVEYATPAEGADPWYAVKAEINAGNPVIVSVRYRKPGYMGSSEPPVEGVPIDSTGGHLVLIRGFTWQDGKEYVIVNDPAARKLEEVRRLYPSDQFFRAWTKKVMYVIHKDEGEVAQACIGAPILGKLVPVGAVAGGTQKYELQVDGTPVNLNMDNMRSIVVSCNGEKTTPVNPRVSALSESNLLWFSAKSKPGKYTYWFMGMDKVTYQAEVDWGT